MYSDNARCSERSPNRMSLERHSCFSERSGPFLFPSEEDPNKHQKTFKTTWRATLRRSGLPYFRIYDLRSTYATRLSAGGVADEFVTQLLGRGTRRSSRS